MTRRVKRHHLEGLPGLRRQPQERLLSEQPSTVREALRIPGVGRKTTRHLLEAGVIDDPDGLQPGYTVRAPNRNCQTGDIVRLTIVERRPGQQEALAEALADLIFADLRKHPSRNS